MRNPFLRLALILAMAVFGPATALADAADFIRTTGQRAIESLAGNDLSSDERENRFRSLFREAFDVDSIARFAVGRYWRLLPDGQQEEYLALFETYVVKAYARRLSEYSGEQLEVIQLREVSPGHHLVLSEIAVPQRQPVRVNWHVKDDGDGFKITDVVVEGVSMSVTQRDEFLGVIRNSGGRVEALLRALRKKTGAS
jgi:phospholipid transport system substrate-binding protein